ncbi:MAG: hypothetical protein GY809_13380 [Planctomycetes bacterium]|nr:hypothetical protein [Planctomycetota bacterium]
MKVHLDQGANIENYVILPWSDPNYDDIITRMLKLSFLSCVLLWHGLVSTSALAEMSDTMAPGRVRDLVADPGDNDGQIQLSFTAPGNDGQSPDRVLNGTFYVTCLPVRSEGRDAKPIEHSFVVKNVNYGDPGKVEIALLGDTQFGFPDGVAHPAVQAARPTMADLKELPHDFLAILGDLVQTDQYWPHHHDEIQDKAARPLYLIGGNAEFYYGLDRFVEHTGFSSGGYVVRLRGLRFIFLTVNGVSGETDHICHIGETQMTWLRQELAAGRESSTAIFFHAPLASTTTGSLPEREMHIYETDALRALFRNHPCVVLFANGHLHRGYGPVRAPQNDGPYTIEDGVLHVSVGRPPYACFAEFSDDGITIRVRDNRKRAWCPGWGTTHRVPLTLEPKALDRQTLTVGNLEPGAVYRVTLRTEDDAGHLAPPSNLARVTARKLPETPPLKPGRMTVVRNAARHTHAFSACYRDVNIRDHAIAYEIEVERCRLRVVDTFKDGDTSSWSFTHAIDVTETNGLLTAHSTTSDSQMLTHLSPPVSGDVFGTILLRLRVPGDARTVEFFWGNETRSICREQSMGVAAEAHGRLVDYQVPVGKHSHWAGHRIRTLRLDPTAKNDHNFAVDSIVLRSSPGAGELVWRSGRRACSALPRETVTPLLPYEGPPLETEISHFWRIRFTDKLGSVGQWSDWTHFNPQIQ